MCVQNNLDRPSIVDKRMSVGRKRTGSNASRKSSFDSTGVEGLVQPIGSETNTTDSTEVP